MARAAYCALLARYEVAEEKNAVHMRRPCRVAGFTTHMRDMPTASTFRTEETRMPSVVVGNIGKVKKTRQSLHEPAGVRFCRRNSRRSGNAELARTGQPRHEACRARMRTG